MSHHHTHLMLALLMCKHLYCKGPREAAPLPPLNRRPMRPSPITRRPAPLYRHAVSPPPIIRRPSHPGCPCAAETRIPNQESRNQNESKDLSPCGTRVQKGAVVSERVTPASRDRLETVIEAGIPEERLGPCLPQAVLFLAKMTGGMRLRG